jgi:hypothetical protein
MLSVRDFVCKVSDDWRGNEGAQAVGCEHGCRHVLGVGGWESEGGFEHILQNGDEEPVEEFLCRDKSADVYLSNVKA